MGQKHGGCKCTQIRQGRSHRGRLVFQVPEKPVQASGKKPFSWLRSELPYHMSLSVCVFQVKKRCKVKSALRHNWAGHKVSCKEHWHEFFGDFHVGGQRQFNPPPEFIKTVQRLWGQIKKTINLRRHSQHKTPRRCNAKSHGLHCRVHRKPQGTRP